MIGVIHPRGFSLIELLVALAIGALLLGILSNALGGVMTATRMTLIENAEQEERLVSVRTISQFLKAAIPPDPRDSNSHFIGTAEAVTFSAIPPESLAPFGMLRVRLYIDKESTGEVGVFVDISSAETNGGVRKLEIRKHCLFRNVNVAGFKYSGGQNLLNQPLDSWSDTTRLPALVGLAVSRAGQDRTISIKVMPRRNVRGNCRFDQISMACRS